MLTKVQARRLLKLAEFLQTVPKERFDMRGDWAVGDSGESAANCGTSGCALGWACTIPSFKRQGLRLEGDTCVEEGSHQAEPTFPGTDNPIEAGEAFFGPGTYDIWYGPQGTPKQVASRIRKFVKRHTKKEPTK